MNLRAQFNRLTAGLALSLAIGSGSGAQPRVPLVPPGENPAWLTKIYQRLTANSGMPQTANMRIFNSIQKFSSVPDDPWLQNLKNMTPEQAEQEVRQCLASLCEHKYPFLTDNDKFIARIMVIEAMFYNGLTEQEFSTYAEFLSRFDPGTAYHTRNDEIISQIVKDIYESDVYNNIRDKLLPHTQITAKNVSEQYFMRRDLMDFVTRKLSAAYGQETTPVYLDQFPPTLNGSGAFNISPHYIPEQGNTRIIVFNYNVMEMDTIDKILEMTGHEYKHSLDINDEDTLNNKGIAWDDFRFNHTAAINLNRNGYIPLCATRTNALQSCAEQYRWYRDQYIERSAYDFGKKLMDKFRQEGQQRRQSSHSRSLEAHKLQLPS